MQIAVTNAELAAGWHQNSHNDQYLKFYKA